MPRATRDRRDPRTIASLQKAHRTQNSDKLKDLQDIPVLLFELSIEGSFLRTPFLVVKH